MREQMSGIPIVARLLGYTAGLLKRRPSGRIEIEFFHLDKYVVGIVDAR